MKKLIYENYTQTKRKLTYGTCTIFRVFQAKETQSGHRLGATGKVAHVASVSVCFWSKDEKRDFRRERNGTRCKRGRGGEGRKFPSVLLLAPFSARSLTLDPRSFLQNSTETLATKATGKGVGKKMTLFYFFLLFIPLLGTRLSPAVSRLKTRNKKQETNNGGAHLKNVGTELELYLNPLRCAVCFAINILGLTHPPTHHQKKMLRIIFIMRPFF